MARRRDQVPPFEIMGRPSGPAPAAPRPEPESEPVTPATGTAAAAARPWWRALDEPLVLRVPRGLALLTLVLVLGVVMLGYWVGKHRGDRAATQRIEERLAGQQLVLPDRVAPPLQRVAESDTGTTAAAASGGQREAGLNYFVLITVSNTAAGRDEVQRLVQFLRQYGVEAAAVSGDNGRFVRVVALRGFPAEAIGTDAYRAYQEKLRQIGREWKAANGGRGNDLSELYAEKYTGP